jgi:hypothetical protein
MRGIDEHEQPHGSDTRRRRRRQSTETETEFQYNARNVFYNTEKPSLNEVVVSLN